MISLSLSTSTRLNSIHKIKSVTCIQQEIMKVIYPVCLTLIFKWSTIGGQVTYISHIDIPNIGSCSKFMTPTLCLYQLYTTHVWTRGPTKSIIWTLQRFSRYILWGQVTKIKINNMRDLWHRNTMKSTRLDSNLYHIYKQLKLKQGHDNSQLDLDFEGQLSRSCDLILVYLKSLTSN